MLENYEEKLGLLSKHEDRNKYLEELRRFPDSGMLPEQYKQQFMEIMDRLQRLE